MKAIMLITGSGPLTVLTSYPSPTDPRLLAELRAKGIEKFIAYEVPLELAQERYGGHFAMVKQDLKETNDFACSTTMASAPTGCSGSPSWAPR